MAINKFISPLVSNQLPSFYQEGSPNFVAFIKAYYEWMEQNDLTNNNSGAVGKARSLLEYMDIDRTEQEFIQHFKNTYIASLPLDVIADQRLLTKHIIELYRTKGTPRAYELLFRLLFNEAVEIDIPSKYILKPSDGIWNVPHYIEVTDNPHLFQLINKTIANSSRTATAVVENVTAKYIGGRRINIVYLSSINGRFKYGEKIYSETLLDDNGQQLITLSNGPLITGSLTAIAVESGGYNYSVGDLLNVSGSTAGSGVDGLARVAAITSENGKVTFNLVSGGSGFSLNALVTVKTTTELILTDTSGVFSIGDVVTDTVTNANGVVSFANSSFLQVIDFSNDTMFVIGDQVQSGSGALAKIVSVTGGGGSGANFRVGSIVNPVVVDNNIDYITNYYNTILSDSDWHFPGMVGVNLTTNIADALRYRKMTVGTIASLAGVDPGIGYSSNPYVDVIEPDIAALDSIDINGNIVGHNATVTSKVVNASGIVTAVGVLSSGFGFNPGETVTLSSNNNSVVITGKSIIDVDGIGEGSWKNHNGFLSDIMKIQDSYYYQQFSYEIATKRMLNTYEDLVKQLVHPAGIALFGKFLISNEVANDVSEAVEFSITQS
jgi:hypothetical protein